MARPRPRRPGFTLVQLVAAAALLAFLAALLLPAVQRVREAAARVGCVNHLHQIALATIHSSDVHESRMPPLAGNYHGDSNGTVFFHVLPYLEAGALYQSSRDGQGNYNVWEAGVYARAVPTYRCPSDATNPDGASFHGWLATGSYAANFLVFGDPDARSLQGKSRYPASIPDGTSYTIFFAERYQRCGEDACAWGYWGTSSWSPMFAYFSQARFQVRPAPDRCDAGLAQSPHPGAINVGIGDGSVRFVAGTISPLTWWAACTPAGNEVLGDDW
jgi:hypothetical protein